MKCLVCGYDFDRDDFCPHCYYPVTFYTDDSEAAEREEQLRAETYRKRLMTGIEVKVTGYEYHYVDGQVKQTGKTAHSFGTAKDLMGKTVWLPQKVTNLFTKTQSADVEYTVLGEVNQLKVSMKADSQAEELLFGAYVDEDLCLHLLLKDDKTQLDDQKFELLSGR